jgi:torulene dioxygenase
MDPRTGELINVLCELKDNPAKYHVISLSRSMDTFQNIPHVGNVVATFLAPPTKLEHFAISERFVIVVIHSNRYSKRMPNYASSVVDGVDSLLKFDEKADTLFYVISRSARQLVAVYRSEPSHVTAVVNAFEGDSDTIYIDVVAGDSLSSNDRLVEIRVTELEELKHQLPPSSTLRRYCLFRLGEEIARFDGAAGQLPSFPLALFHHLTDYSLSSPVISPSFVGTPYRHAFGLTIDRDNRGKPGFLPNAIVKCDLSTPIRSKQWHRTGCYASAPLFIPRAELAYPASTARTEDDDGVIVTAVLDVFSQKSFLVVLDARDLRELARYTLPKSIPITPSTPVWCPNRASLALPPAFVEVPEKTALLPRE